MEQRGAGNRLANWLSTQRCQQLIERLSEQLVSDSSVSMLAIPLLRQQNKTNIASHCWLNGTRKPASVME